MPAVNGVPAYNYAHFSAATGATVLKNGPGMLHSVVIGNPGSAMTVTLMDGSNVIAVLAPTASGMFVFDAEFITDLNVAIAGTTVGDVTVNWS